MPRNFYFVTVDWRGVPFAPDRLYAVRTDHAQARTAKPPYKEIMLSGMVEGQFLFKTAIAKHVLPFLVLEPADLFLPVEIEEGSTKLRTARELKDRGYRDAGDWMAAAEAQWEKHRGPKLARSTLVAWLDYSNKLTKQPLDRRYLVLYNAAGTNLSAAVLDRKNASRPFFVDAKLYYFPTSRVQEAHYLAAVLNADSINQIIKPFQSTGLQGERDIHKKVLELPIPTFDSAEPAHMRLSTLGATARTQLDRWIKTEPAAWPNSLARQRALVRAEVREHLAQIDELVQELLG